MNEQCSICGYPKTWSDDHQRVWCSVWGGAHDTPIVEPCSDCLQRARWARARETRRLRAVS